MVKLSKLYTKKGDDGKTGLVGGKRVDKDSLRVAAYGEIDELNAAIGMARTCADENSHDEISSALAKIQNTLFNLGAELATDPNDEWDGMVKIGETSVHDLEKQIDAHVAQVPELKSFVLPGGTMLNAYLHLARTICRRAERTIVTLSKQEKVRKESIMYVNRLSDYLFALSRYASHLANQKEYLWAPGEDSPED